MHKAVKKYGFRVLVAVFVYFFFRITSENVEESVVNDPRVWSIIILFTTSVVLIIWEICDFVINYFSKHYPNHLTSKKMLASIFIMTTLATFPFVTGFIYFENYYLKVWLNCVSNSYSVFLTDLPQGFVVTWLVISGEILRLYYINLRNMEVEQTRMQKELLRTQYESLKNQVNPHFLFNNFSVLTALIHKDADLASNFVTQLSKLYRYILDNKENEMVSLAREFECLDSYLFLLKIRHEESIHLEINIDIEAKDFYVPTLSLQMLIENAVKHNSFNKRNPLKIRIYNDAEQFIIVENVLNLKNGVRDSTKVGLENIKNRYNLKSDQKVVVYQSEGFFAVKLPMLTSLSPS
ncbi:MAG TPA: histidine kinase [Fulvivirga sp.]|nr:histidine kinase [Fulvivirga sp.]